MNSFIKLFKLVLALSFLMSHVNFLCFEFLNLEYKSKIFSQQVECVNKDKKSQFKLQNNFNLSKFSNKDIIQDSKLEKIIKKYLNLSEKEENKVDDKDYDYRYRVEYDLKEMKKRFWSVWTKSSNKLLHHNLKSNGKRYNYGRNFYLSGLQGILIKSKNQHMPIYFILKKGVWGVPGK